MPGSKLSLTTTLPLPNSTVLIPQLGFGVYLSPQNQCTQSCITALTAGYRHIDTAQCYGNEAAVAQAVHTFCRAQNVPRSEIFVTTKIVTATGNAEKTYDSLLESVRLFDGPNGEEGYVDLFLIHNSTGGLGVRKELWRALEKLYEQGRTRSIGVSNWGIGHIEEMKGYAKVWPPHVDQIELHPFCQQRALVSYLNTHKITISAYSPLIRNLKSSCPPLVQISSTHKKTTAQILVRYSLQKGWNPLPKSDNPERIRENADVFDFELSKEEMKVLDDLDEGRKGAVVQFVENTV